jgi:vitamin B12 transporter
MSGKAPPFQQGKKLFRGSASVLTASETENIARPLPITKVFMKINLLLLTLSSLLILSLYATARAQDAGKISGVITVNGRAAANSSVTLTSANTEVAGTRADSSGHFIFENIKPGSYILTATAAGHTTTRTFLVATNESVIVNVEATQADAGGIRETVTVSAGTAQPLEDVSKSVSVLTSDEIENRNEFSVVDALKIIPGLRVQQLGGFGRTANIKIRGLRNQDTAVLIDGQRFRDPTAITGDASPFLGDLATTTIRRVEVLRGSGSSLYGTNAVGGVLNIQTDNFTRDFRGSILAEGGGLGLFRGRANFSGAFNDKAFMDIAISHTNLTKGLDGDDTSRNTGGKLGFQYRFTDKLKLTTRLYVSDAFVKLNSNPDTIGTLPATTQIVDARPLSRSELKRFENGTPISQLSAGDATFIPDADDPDAFQKSRFYNFHIALDGSAAENSTYRISYQNLSTRRRNSNGPGGIGFQPFGGTEASDFDGNIQTFQAKTNIAARRNLITLGYGYEREKFGNKNFAVAASDNNSTTAVQSGNTFVAQDQVELLGSRLHLSGAVRAQFFNLGNPQFSSVNAPYQNLTLSNPPAAYTFDASGAYYFRSSATKLRSHAGNGYRVPSLYERFGTFYATFLTPNQFVPLGDPGLKSERSFGFDAGVDQNFRSDKVLLSATYFYTKLINTIEFGTLPQPDPYGRINGLSGGGYFNTKGGISRGAEFSLDARPVRNTNIFASYTFTKSLQRAPQVAGSGILTTLGIPRRQFGLSATRTVRTRLTVNLDFLATGDYLAPVFSNAIFSTRIYRFKGARKADITVAYRFPTRNEKVQWRLFGTIENLFNYDYYENGFRTGRRTIRGGLQLSF